MIPRAKTQKLVLSPRLGIRWENGRILVAAAGSGERLVATDPRIVDLLHLFSTPITLEDALARIAGERGEAARRMIEQLQQIGGLVPVAAEGSPRYLERDEAEARFAARRAGMDFLRESHGGLTVTNCGCAELSPGCQACKAGTWLYRPRLLLRGGNTLSVMGKGPIPT